MYTSLLANLRQFINLLLQFRGVRVRVLHRCLQGLHSVGLTKTGR